MSKEWKPGDVGMSAYGPVFYTAQSEWVFDDGSTTVDPAPAKLRPLVVLDPEDREAVERLGSLFFGLFWREKINSTALKCLTAALREFAAPTPPKPEEPQGLGAVVEDADGRRWTQVGVGCWIRRGGGLDGFGWGEIAAVRVLSEGVTP